MPVIARWLQRAPGLYARLPQVPVLYSCLVLSPPSSTTSSHCQASSSIPWITHGDMATNVPFVSNLRCLSFHYTITYCPP
ncbi:hypothetical protein C8R47DRAFT_1165467 [Mycena vitilis]|nr:hypothetical protein C8R47DRAFT_1165467 [Mycena vitilis]